MNADITKTQKIPPRKISLTKIESQQKDRRKIVIGWELDFPQKGKRYTLYLRKGVLLKTSPIQDIEETFTGLIIKTANSKYLIEYVR